MTADVLVTGANGFFGLAIVRALSSSGLSVIASDRSPEGEFTPRTGTESARVEYVARDLATEPLDELIAQVTTVVHAAALTPGEESGKMLDTLLSVNLTPLTGVLSAIRTSTPPPRLIFISSAGVYNQHTHATLTEADGTGGTTLYGAAKLAAELVVARYASLADLEFCMLRPTSLFGPGERTRPSRPRTTAFRQLVDAIGRGVPVRVQDAASRADWLHVDDAAEAVAALARADRLPGCAMNLSSAQPRPLSDLVTGLKCAGLRIEEDAACVIAGGSDRPAVIDNARLRAAVAWVPRRSFTDAAKTMLADDARATCSI